MFQVRNKVLVVSAISLSIGALGGCNGEMNEPSSPQSSVPSRLAAIPNPPWPSEFSIPETRIDKPMRQQLSAKDITHLEKQAYVGDAHSARLIMQYYADPAASPSQEFIKWRKIAAENGDSQAAGLLSLDFERLGGEENCLRAKFWQERALQLGQAATDEVATTHLSNLLALAQTWNECLARGAQGVQSLVEGQTENAQ